MTAEELVLKLASNPRLTTVLSQAEMSEVYDAAAAILGPDALNMLVWNKWHHLFSEAEVRERKLGGE